MRTLSSTFCRRQGTFPAYHNESVQFRCRNFLANFGFTRSLRARFDHIELFCQREFVDKVEGFGEADVLSDEAEPRWIRPEFARPFGFPAGGHPLCQAASSDGNTSTSPPSAWIVSWFNMIESRSKFRKVCPWPNHPFRVIRSLPANL